ncbi:hypothetical protein ACFOD3_25575 [Falsiroseomonas tokyonensis]|uniref:Uncharacterized protein n=2 Tax=Falsiroseomonas tokyonensis TaxID=430521 RepID=A0ABV7C2A2_9PROT|nr:hypothetical protein [Falsiroseomonas tokyonensis]
MMRRQAGWDMAMRVAMVAAALCALAGVAAAKSAPETAAALSVSPPAGYEVRPLPPRPPYATIFGVRRPSDRDTGCQVSFAEDPATASLSQAQLNEAVQNPVWRDTAIRAMSPIYDIQHQETYRQGDLVGLLLEGMIRPREGLPARAQEIRTLFVILQTPRGRTSTVCVGEVADFATRRAEFLTVAQGATPPR